MTIAEQSTQSRFWSSSSLPDREIDLVARVEIGGDAAEREGGVDVDARLLYDPLPPAWDDLIAARIYDGIHAGLAAVAAPLPSAGLRVTISRLGILPEPPPTRSSAELEALGETVRGTIASTIESLWLGLRSSAAANAVQMETPPP